eukprot:COSAG02_NODE_19588_length_874_cov_1.437419_2_plen_32_part_01
MLGESYSRAMNSGGKRFQVVYVSSDHDEAAMY